MRRPREILHPFLGFVLNSEAPDSCWTDAGWPAPAVGPLGFEEISCCAAGLGPAVEIVFLGSSVAKSLCQDRGQEIAEALRHRGGFGGRPVRLRCFAAGGYKQPQQLFLLQWLLFLGERFDIVVNADGFTEAALSPFEARRSRSPVSFPRAWVRYARPANQPELCRLLTLANGFFAVEATTGRMHRRSRFPPLRVALRLMERAAARGRRVLAERLRRRDYESYTHMASGPFGSSDVDSWASANLCIARLCQAYGAAYVHLVHPSQYAVSPDRLHADVVDLDYLDPVPLQAAYRELRARIPSLREQGVPTVDLSELLPEYGPAYFKDALSHLTLAANILFSEAAVDAILDALRMTRDERTVLTA